MCRLQLSHNSDREDGDAFSMGFRDWPRWFIVSGMSKSTEDPLVAEIRQALMPGQFVKGDAVSGLVESLDQVRETVEASVKAGEAERALRLYEVFLTGVYAKIEKRMTNTIWRISFIA